MNPAQSDCPLRLFLVEDSTSIRQRMAARFKAIEGVEIVGEAEDSDGALTGISATAADVVIVDLHLSGGTGMDVLRGLTQGASPVIAIVLTNHSGSGFRQACLASGARYFFDKTSEFELACDAIEGIARGH